MDKRFSSIKAVGFDLDGTLYPMTPEMREVVAHKVIQAVLGIKPELKIKEKTENFLREKYKKTNSWSKVLIEVGVKNPTEVLARSLASADVLALIKRDEAFVDIIRALHEKYFLFIITGSLRRFAFEKLEKIGIDPNLFSYSFFGDDPHFTSKTEPGNFKYFLSQSKYAPEEHVYIGDNLHTDIVIPSSLGIKTIMVGRHLPEADSSVIKIYDILGLLL